MISLWSIQRRTAFNFVRGEFVKIRRKSFNFEMIQICHLSQSCDKISSFLVGFCGECLFAILFVITLSTMLKLKKKNCTHLNVRVNIPEEMKRTVHELQSQSCQTWWPVRVASHFIVKAIAQLWTCKERSIISANASEFLESTPQNSEVAISRVALPIKCRLADPSLRKSQLRLRPRRP